ncbi:MAG: tobH protein [Rhodococcus sp.]|nr:tobH protein [Rhodococcus sp. (in: high G+C Gram-positive bacteria)]
MSTPTPMFDLDDSDALISADRDGLLRSAATGGAQVRATQSAVDEGALDRLVGLRPRSVVLVTGEGLARRGAAVISAVLAQRVPFPIVQVSSTPSWVGPLDVVVVAGDDAGDPRLAQSVHGALRRGAEVVLAAPDEGPLRDAAAGAAARLEPRVYALPRHTLLRFVAVYLAVLAAIDSSRWDASIPSLDQIADAADAEAMQDRPTNEVFHNPAKSLASRIVGRRAVFTGASDATVELARHGAEAVLFGGIVASSAPLSTVVPAAAALAYRAEPTDSLPTDSLFHDPEFDGPAADAPVRTFVVTPVSEQAVTAQRTGLLADAELVVADRDDTGTMTELEQIAMITGRLDMVAAYLQLTGGR